MENRGAFIIIEGGDGAGKTTIVERLKKEFPDVVYTRDPGGTRLGEQLRSILMSKDSSGMDARAELLLFLAAEAQLVAEVIEPALTAGKTVITTRFTPSAIAYQIYGRQQMELLSLLRTISEATHGRAIPDACVLLDVTPSVGLARVHSRAEELTRFDAEELAFHERVREGYKKHVGEFGRAYTIDANRPLEEVWKDVLNTVQSLV